MIFTEGILMSDVRKEVVEQFMHLQMLLHRHQMHTFMHFGPWGNPHRGQGRVLSILKMKPEMSQRELAYLLNMSKQSMAELLGKLEKSGYIKRETSEDDRRSFTIKLTEEGAAAAGVMDDAPSGLEKLFDCLNDDELSTFREYLGRIIGRLEEQFGGDDDMRTHVMEGIMGRLRHHFSEHERPFGRKHGSGFFGGGFSDGFHRRRGDTDDRER
jgi:DNA-binding MarR family transcriptional regulator